MEKNNENALFKESLNMVSNLIPESVEHGNGLTTEKLKERVMLVGKDLLNEITLYEPTRNNRFIVEFPAPFNIKPWYITSIRMPAKVNNKYTDTAINIKQIGDKSNANTRQIIDLFNKKNYELHVCMLGSHMEVVEKWCIEIKKLTYCDFGGELDYANDNVCQINLQFKTKKIYLK